MFFVTNMGIVGFLIILVRFSEIVVDSFGYLWDWRSNRRKWERNLIQAESIIVFFSRLFLSPFFFFFWKLVKLEINSETVYFSRRFTEKMPPAKTKTTAKKRRSFPLPLFVGILVRFFEILCAGRSPLPLRGGIPLGIFHWSFQSDSESDSATNCCYVIRLGNRAGVTQSTRCREGN